MSESNVVNIRYYHLITVKGKLQLATKVGEKWEFDASCNTINEMLDNGLIDPSAAQGWANQQTYQYQQANKEAT